MAQVVKLKRTAVEGKVPSTSNLELGELAINTYDGRIFFEKDNGTPSIQQVVTTNSDTTGSLTIQGNVTASYFFGDGSGLTNLPNPDVSQVATVTSSFDNQSSITVTHNFGSKNVFISVYDNSDSQIIPESVVLTNNNTITVGLSANHSGYVVVGKGGHIVSGTIVQEISEVATVTASFDNQSSINVSHNFNSRNVIVSVYDSSYSQLIPQTLTLTDENSVDITLSGNQSGHVVIAKGGHFITGSVVTSYNSLTNKPSGLVSGSSQLTSSYDTRYALSSQTASLATTGSNTFVGTQTLSGSIIPATDNTYDLGSPTYQWKDIYVSSGSLYIDGTKVLGSTGNELQITTDVGQSIKILEAGSDSIILQSADGDIQLKTSGGGNLLFDPTTGLIDVRGTFQIQDGYKVTSSGGNTIQFGNDIGITGSINTTGNINGVNVSTLQSTFNTFTGSSNTTLSGLNTYTSSVKNAINVIGEGTSSVTTIYGNLVVEGTTLTVSASNLAVADNMIYLNDGNEITDPDLGIAGNYNDGTYAHTGIFSDASDSHTWKVYKGYVPEPSQSIDITHGTFTLADFQAETLKGAIAATNGVVSGSSQISYVGLSNIPTGIVSGSAQVVGILSSLNTYTGSNDTTNTAQNSRLTNIEAATGSYETKGRGIVSGSSQITYTGISSIPGGIVSGSSQITFSGISSLPTLVSGSSQIDVMSTTNIARLATTGSNQFVGTQYITGSIYMTGDGGASGQRLTFNNTTAGESQYALVNGGSMGTGVFGIRNGSTGTNLITIGSTGNMAPASNGTQDLGSATNRWSTIYTSDLSLNNGIGDWTIVEGEDDLFLYNNKKGKVYKFALTEVDPSVATPKKS